MKTGLKIVFTLAAVSALAHLPSDIGRLDVIARNHHRQAVIERAEHHDIELHQGYYQAGNLTKAFFDAKQVQWTDCPKRDMFYDDVMQKHELDWASINYRQAEFEKSCDNFMK